MDGYDSAYPSDEKNNGDGSHYRSHLGFSKREAIALAALQGMLAHPRRYEPRKGESSNWHDAIAVEAFEIADAVIRNGERRR